MNYLNWVWRVVSHLQYMLKLYQVKGCGSFPQELYGLAGEIRLVSQEQVIQSSVSLHTVLPLQVHTS